MVASCCGKAESIRFMSTGLKARRPLSLGIEKSRCGELLKEIAPALNQHDAEDRARVGTHPSRKQAAKEAGLSDNQQKTVIRVANVPSEDFEAQVESEDPPTVTELAEQGKAAFRAKHGFDPPEDPKAFAAATEVMGTLRLLSEYFDQHSPELVSAGLSAKEKPRVLNHSIQATTWLRSWQGTQKRTPLIDLEGIDPEDFKQATHAIGFMEEFTRFVIDNQPECVLAGLKKSEKGEFRNQLRLIAGWIDLIEPMLEIEPGAEIPQSP